VQAALKIHALLLVGNIIFHIRQFLPPVYLFYKVYQWLKAATRVGLLLDQFAPLGKLNAE
jgi:hypothetical protein